MPEYKAIRQKLGGFLELCYSKEAVEVTMQPIRRFNFDAAIIFADILIVPHSLGLDLKFEQGEGPILEQLKDSNDLRKLKISKSNFQFDKIWETTSGVKKELSNDKALIGFAGAPWTVATYILEGRGKTNFATSRNLVKNDPTFVTNLLEIITQQTINYLKGQIDAGADVIQIFDSWASVLNDFENKEKYIIDPVKNIVSELRDYSPDTKIICFPKGINYLEKYIEKILPDGVSLGSETSLEEAKNLQKFCTVQGNLSNEILVGEKAKIEKETIKILNELAGKNFIFNLGHGILQNTPIENVEFLVEIVRNYEK